MKHAVVLGSQHLGGAITRALLADKIQVTTIARTATHLSVLEHAGAMGIEADAADPDTLYKALNLAATKTGPADLIVNAISAAQPPDDGTGFGGGQITTASRAGLEGWTTAVTRPAFAFLHAGGRVLQGRPGTLIQLVGAPARRANPNRGPIAAGAAAIRALTHAAAQELRPRGIHVALLIIDGVIASPKTATMTKDRPANALIHNTDVIDAVRYLATQSAHGMTHELTLTAAGDRWLP